MSPYGARHRSNMSPFDRCLAPYGHWKARKGTTARGKVRPRSKVRNSPGRKVARAAASGGMDPLFASAARSMAGERSKPTTATPARAISQATLPVPTAPSSTGPPHSRARAAYQAASPSSAVPAKTGACMAS